MSNLISSDALYHDLTLNGFIKGFNFAIEFMENLPLAVSNNQVHLCDFCKYDYRECQAEKDDIIFGNGRGHDNICACAKFEIKPKQKGNWIEDSDPGQIIGEHYSCSECRVCHSTLKSNFCPNCGADMRRV